MPTSRPGRRLAPAATFVLLLLAGTAGAQSRPKTEPAPAAAAPAKGVETAARRRLLPVALALTDNAQAQAAQVAYVVESAARRSPRHEFIDPVERFDPAGVEARAQARLKGTDALVFGRKSYENLEEGLGLESFDRAIAAFEESALWDNFKGLSQALAWRILVKWADDPQSTRKELQRLMAVNPKTEFPADLVPPDLQQEIARVRETYAAETKFALDVNTTPVAARVYVDGAYRGTTPTSVKGLVQGEHYVSLVAPGYTVVQQKVRAGPGATATVALEPAVRAKPFLTFLDRIRKGYGDVDEVTAARVLGRVCEADEVLVAGVKRGNGRLQISLHRVQVSDGHVAAIGELELAENASDFAAQVNRAAELAFATDRPHGDKNAPLGVKSNLESMVSRFTDISEEKVKLGVGIGGGVLLLSGAVIGLVANSKETEVRTLVQTDPRLDDELSSGFATAVTADVLMVAGLAAIGTWGWLQFGKAQSKKGEIETPPVLEQKPEERKPKKKEEDDPFASLAPGFDLAPFARAAGGEASFGLRGSF